MKHPVLTRVFAIILAVFSVILLGASALGIKETIEDHEDELYTLDLLKSRVETYSELTEKLSGKKTYAEMSAEYDNLTAEHEKASAQHRTDLAINTATRAGLKEAREQLVNAGGMLIEADRQLKEKAAMLNEQKQKALEAAGAENIDGAISQIEGALEVIGGMLPEQTYQPNGEGSGEPNDPIQAEASAYEGLPLEIMQMLMKFIPPEQIPTVKQQVLEGNYSFLIPIKTQLETSLAGLQELKKYDNMMAQGASGIGEGWAAINDAVYMINQKEDDMNEKYAELEEEKTKLLAESEDLKIMQSDLIQLKSDEKHLSSTETLLLANEEIKQANEGGTGIYEAGKAEIDNLEKSIHNEYVYRLTMWGLAIAAAICALIGIPAAFEKTKSRVMLILPIVLYTLFSAAACFIAYYIGRGISYSTLFAAIFGLLQLIITIPKEKDAA